MGETSAEVWEGRGIVVDARYWPALIERMPVEFPNESDAIDAWIGEVERVIRARREAFVMIVDTLLTKKPADARARRRMAEWLSGSEPYRAYCLGAVFIVGSPLVRGVLTALNWVTRPHPLRVVVSNWSEALAETRGLLKHAGLAVPLEFERQASSVSSP